MFINKKKCNEIDDSVLINSIKCSSDIDPIYSNVSKIVAIGDIHGDFESLIYCLYSAELIDDNLKWKGGNTFVVQTGDLIDDGRKFTIDETNKIFNPYTPHEPCDELIILDFLADLDIQAEKDGGRVLLCIGNHELMNVTDNIFQLSNVYDNYIRPETAMYYKRPTILKRRMMFKLGGDLCNKLSCILNSFVIINNYIFLHGGLNALFLKEIGIDSSTENTIELLLQFNRNIKKFLKGEMNEEELINIIHLIRHTNSIFWDRTYSSVVNLEDCDFLDLRNNILKIPDLKMVIGHSVQKKISKTCGENIYKIDTAISRAFSNPIKYKPTDHSDRIHFLVIQKDKEPIQYKVVFINDMPIALSIEF
jgi:hypothetical protein